MRLVWDQLCEISGRDSSTAVGDLWLVMSCFQFGFSIFDVIWIAWFELFMLLLLLPLLNFLLPLLLLPCF